VCWPQAFLTGWSLLIQVRAAGWAAGWANG
jgi:hypothetical protein